MSPNENAEHGSVSEMDSTSSYTHVIVTPYA